MDQFLEVLKVLSAIGFPSLFAIGAFFYQKVSKKIIEAKSEDKAIKLALQCMMRDTLLKRYKELMKDDMVTYEDIANYKMLYEQYKALGGNDIITHLYEQVVSLEIK